MADKYKEKYKTGSMRLSNWNYNSNATYFITISTKYKKHFFGKIENGKMILNELGKFVETEWKRTVELRPDMNLKLGNFVVMPNHFHGIIIIGKNRYNQQKSNQAIKEDLCYSGETLQGGDQESLHSGYQKSFHSGDAMHRVSTDGKDLGLSNNLVSTDSKDFCKSDNLVSTDGKDSNKPENPISAELQNHIAELEKIIQSKILKKGYRNKFGPQSKNLSSIIRGFKSAVTTKARKLGNNNFDWQSLYYDSILRTEGEFYTVQKYIKNNPKKWELKFNKL